MITKNLRIFFRNKSSIIVLFISLFILLIIILALISNNSKNIIITYYEENATNLSNRIKSLLKQNSTILYKVDNINSCTESVKSSYSKLCLVFPSNFTVNSNQSLTLFVDQSKINIAYLILDKIETSLNLVTKQQQKQLINKILDAYSNNTETLESIDALLKNTDDTIKIKNEITHIRLLLNNMNTSVKQFNTTALQSSVSSLALSYKNLLSTTKNILNLYKDFYENVQELNSTYNFSESEINLSYFFNNYFKLKQEYLKKFNYSNKLVVTLLENLSDLIDIYNSENKNLNVIEKKKEAILEDLVRIENDLDSLSSLQTKIRTTINELIISYNSIPVRDLDILVNPIKSEIKPIYSSSNKLIILPSILSILIVFSSLLFSSSIIVSNKLSRGNLREQLTRKGKSYFYFSIFISSLFLVFLETLVFLIIFSFGLNLSIKQFLMLLLYTSFSIVVFTLLGLLIGNLCNNKETAAFFSLIFTLIFIILSGDFVPVEFLPLTYQIVSLLPYDLLKRMIFSIITNSISYNFISIFIKTNILYIIVFSLLSYITFSLSSKNKSKTLLNLKRLSLHTNKNKKQNF